MKTRIHQNIHIFCPKCNIICPKMTIFHPSRGAAAPPAPPRSSPMTEIPNLDTPTGVFGFLKKSDQH